MVGNKSQECNSLMQCVLDPKSLSVKLRHSFRNFQPFSHLLDVPYTGVLVVYAVTF